MSPRGSAATRLIVYGTDTGVGKTVVTAALAAAAGVAGHAVRVLKPAQTGAASDDDAATVDALAGVGVARTGWRLQAPLAPAVAARLEGRALEPRQLMAWVRRESLRSGLTLVETAGGVAVELVEGFDMAALGARLRYPGLVVCRPGLGTLNHTVLSVEHLRAAQAPIAGLVVSGMPAEPGPAESTNLAELSRLTRLPLIAVLPRLRLRPGRAFTAAAVAAFGPLVGGTMS